jgi:hypothetical protein
VIPAVEEDVGLIGGEIARRRVDAGAGLELDELQERVEDGWVERVERRAGKPPLDDQVPLPFERPVPHDLRRGINPSREQRQVRRRPARLLVRAVAVARLHDQRAELVALDRPGEAVRPRLPERAGRTQRAADRGGEP